MNYYKIVGVGIQTARAWLPWGAVIFSHPTRATLYYVQCHANIAIIDAGADRIAVTAITK